jgi:hypothetical protein
MERPDRQEAGDQPSEDQMTQEFAFDMSGHGAKKMPAADPGVRRAAEAMLDDPAGYFAYQGEQARQEARQALEQRLAKLPEQAPSPVPEEHLVGRALGRLACIFRRGKQTS